MDSAHSPRNGALSALAGERGFAAHLACLLDEFLDHPPLGFDGDAMRHLDQQLNQAVRDLALTRDTVKPCQTYALRSSRPRRAESDAKEAE